MAPLETATNLGLSLFPLSSLPFIDSECDIFLPPNDDDDDMDEDEDAEDKDEEVVLVPRDQEVIPAGYLGSDDDDFLLPDDRGSSTVPKKDPTVSTIFIHSFTLRDLSH